jgi:uncharacterized membrane protein YjjP (DUF1212 family)
LHPRSKESLADENASNRVEDLQKVCDVQEIDSDLRRDELQYEEILQ